MSVDGAGNVYISDTFDNELRKVSRAGTITRIAGTGTPCRTAAGCGEGIAATNAMLNSLWGIVVDPVGSPGPTGKLVLVAFKASVARGRVIVRYALTGDASISLAVKPLHGRPVVVARARGRAGLGRLAWNRKLHGIIARHGSYKLIVTAAWARTGHPARSWSGCERGTDHGTRIPISRR